LEAARTLILTPTLRAEIESTVGPLA